MEKYECSDKTKNELTHYIQAQTHTILPPDTLTALINKLLPYRLTKNEKLQIANTLPVSMITLELILYDSDNRFTPQEKQAILNIIKEVIS